MKRDRCTKGAGCGPPCAKPKLSGRKLEGCCSVADDSPGGSRSRANEVLVVYAPAAGAMTGSSDRTMAIDTHTGRGISTAGPHRLMRIVYAVSRSKQSGHYEIQ